MDATEVLEDLAREEGGSIILLVIDGLGGLPHPDRGGTELQMADTPNLDRLATESGCGLLEMVGPGITPGSGPGHLALFGYDPLKYTLGRGILSALGIGFELEEGDVAARMNFASINDKGEVTDRRAGRIDTPANERLCRRIRDNLSLDFDGQCFLETVSEHRAVLIFRGEDLGGRLRDTDPQRVGSAPLPPEALDEDSARTARLVSSFVEQCRDILSDEPEANMVLLRGFDSYSPLPSLEMRFGLHGLCVAQYPMYRGISRLLDMALADPVQGTGASFRKLESLYGEDHDFYFLHMKHPDSRGEDGDFDAKIAALEEIDRRIPIAANLPADVFIVTGDHSTPSAMGMHSWHPVPWMLRSKRAMTDGVERFDESACLAGSLGIRPGIHLMGLALAHAERLKKYGA